MAQIRSFDPSLVQRKHVFPKTLVYGSDTAGIKLRLDRFEEVLVENGDAPVVYSNLTEAIGYISSGDMFADSICVIVKDISDALKSSTDSKRLYTSLIRSLSTYDDASTIVLGAPQQKSSAALSKLVKDLEALGGVCREVSAPDTSSAARWLDEYLKSIGDDMSAADKVKVMEVSQGDVLIVQDIMSIIGSEIPNLSADEISHWLDKNDDYSPSDIRAMIASRDISAMSDFMKSFKDDANGYRMFLLKMRTNTLDLLIAAAGGVNPLLTFKQSQYANSNGKSAYFIARETSSADYRRLALFYNELNRQIDAVSIGKSPSFEQLIMSIARAD